MGPEPEIAKIIPYKGSFYSLSIDDQVKRHLGEVTCSNGLAWSIDNKNFYYIDSGTYEIHQYDFDITNGEISNKKVVFSLKEAGIEGFADGHTIDTDGNLWVAIFNGSRVIKIDPRRQNALLQTVEIPAKQVTSVTFGGANFDELYVTTAGTIGNDSMLPSPNGALFRVTGLGVKGFDGVKAK
ncbi:hypothetical protein AMK59_7555 [Oryctes borbonicus]|uniref:SMP-30/Gluconolactonase/LRE-like region domain-containing protein n=1 Tax=Oryctes borbonicus TaxID=1629725 RepID=A0A0T6AXG7_9SCAR|nr:hypothetical protein AMK59_7555 [Oryctes borbonicus]